VVRHENLHHDTDRLPEAGSDGAVIVEKELVNVGAGFKFPHYPSQGRPVVVMSYPDTPGRCPMPCSPGRQEKVLFCGLINSRVQLQALMELVHYGRDSAIPLVKK
jgi:hypothetical protein